MAITARHKRNIDFSMAGMTDVVFQLLIFFMISATLIVPVAMNVLLPHRVNTHTAGSLDSQRFDLLKTGYYFEDENVISSIWKFELKSIVTDPETLPQSG